MEKPIVVEKWTSAGTIEFGMTCTKAERRTRCASADRGLDEGSRAHLQNRSPGKPREKWNVKARAMMTFRVLGPLKPTSANANTKSGKAWKISAARMIAPLDNLAIAVPPAKKPESTPSATPQAKATVVETSAMVRSTRGAASTREKMSIPETSVPNQCVAFGRDQAGAGRRLDGERRDQRADQRQIRLIAMTTNPKIMLGRVRGSARSSLSRKWLTNVGGIRDEELKTR